MLVFDHNKHQVDQAESLAKKMGFKWFRAKVSKRFNSYPVDFLNPPKGWRDPIVTEGKISCQALIESSAYISAKGIVHPCCWVGSIKTATLDQFSFIQDSWTTEKPYEICKNTCTKNLSGTSFTNQWQREIEFQ